MGTKFKCISYKNNPTFHCVIADKPWCSKRVPNCSKRKDKKACPTTCSTPGKYYSCIIIRIQ